MLIFKDIDPTQTKSWKKLEQHFDEIKDQTLIELFKKEPNRLEYLSFDWGNFYFDFQRTI